MECGRVVFNVIVTSRHYMALRQLAEARGEAMAVTLRTLIREAAERQGLWPAQLGGDGENVEAMTNGQSFTHNQGGGNA